MAKRTKRDCSASAVLPDPFDLMQREATATSRLRESVEAINSVDLFGAEFGFSEYVDTSEDLVAVWLFCRFGVEYVLQVANMCTQVPAVGLTSQERMRKIAANLGSSQAITTDTLRLVVDTTEKRCSALLRKQDSVLLLSPPTSDCYQCNSPLVKNHECGIRYYSAEGLRTGVKVTLRCKKCSIIYNYAQYGDKERSGFQFYPEQRLAVEVSDTLFFGRNVLEMQCQLA